MSLLKDIKENEGFVPYIYKDSRGFDTVGYGFLVSSLSKAELELNGGRIEPMSSEVAEQILLLKINRLREDVYAQLKWLQAKPLNVQEVIIEMAYQLGLKGLLGFKNTLNYIRIDELDKASENMRKSRWYKQTPNRVEKLIKKLKAKK